MLLIPEADPQASQIARMVLRLYTDFLGPISMLPTWRAVLESLRQVFEALGLVVVVSAWKVCRPLVSANCRNFCQPLEEI